TVHEVCTWNEQKRSSIGSHPTIFAVHPDGARLAIAGNRGQEVQVRDTASGDLLQKMSTPEGALSVAWHPDGVLLAVGCVDRTIRLWDTVTERHNSVLRGHQAGVDVVGFAAGGDLLVSWAWDGSIRIWDVSAGQELVRFSGLAPQLSRDGHHLVSATGEN